MPTHRPTPVLATLALWLLPLSAAAGDDLTPERFSQSRPGMTSAGPVGLARRVDHEVAPATFHAHAAKPLTPLTVEEIAEQSEPPAQPPSLDAEPPAGRPEAAAEGVDGRSAAGPSAGEPDNRLVSPSAAQRLLARRREPAPSFPNPLESLLQWRPSSQQLAATVGAGLVAVGMLISVVWLIRCCTPQSARVLPRDVVEVLGRAPLGGKQMTQLVRVGPKLVLVAITPEGVETLTEITDPAEVARLVAACEHSRGAGAEAEFDSLLQQMSLTRADDGFLGGYADHDPHDHRDGPRGFADGAFDPRSLAAAYANTPGGRGDG
ncbi:flagellar biosynthetic protein FliO [Botrimarina sp.]|uniref:FliO/MopB family protein n=1 Tax=Botrimarina sp. TaxID=2795802 RepID=UPI0032F08CE8